MRGKSQHRPATSSAALSRPRGVSAAESMGKPRRRLPAPKKGAQAPLTLLPGYTRPMSSEEERQLVEALAELLVEWVEAALRNGCQRA